MTRSVRLRPAVVALLTAAPLLLSACGGDEQEPPSKADLEPGNACRTEGTIEAEPAGNLRSAVEPYKEPGHRLRISERFGDTAEVQLNPGGSGATPAQLTLVRTAEGWVVTSVARC